MYARVLTGVARAGEPDAPARLGTIVAGLRGEPGFCGALSLARAPGRQVLLVVFWETERQAVAGACLPGFAVRADEVWEVAARI